MRKFLLTAVVALLVVSAGCVGLITGETVEFEASNATVADDATESAGYGLNNSTQREITRDVSFLGQERTIRVVNHVNRYTKNGTLGGNATDAVDTVENETLQRVAENESVQQAAENRTVSAPDAARFVVVSSPGAKVLGQTLNPAAGWGNDRILEQVSEQTGKLDNVEFQENRTTESLGESRTVSEFTATTEIRDQNVDVQAHVASFEHEGDVIIVVAVHPEAMDEEDDIDEMLAGIDHSGN